MDRDRIIERTEEVRQEIAIIRDECEIPSIAHAAHQADVYCHGILWELGAEEATTPELDNSPNEDE
jgi:hypothetical protein